MWSLNQRQGQSTSDDFLLSFLSTDFEEHLERHRKRHSYDFGSYSSAHKQWSPERQTDGPQRQRHRRKKLLRLPNSLRKLRSSGDILWSSPGLPELPSAPEMKDMKKAFAAPKGQHSKQMMVQADSSSGYAAKAANMPLQRHQPKADLASPAKAREYLPVTEEQPQGKAQIVQGGDAVELQASPAAVPMQSKFHLERVSLDLWKQPSSISPVASPQSPQGPEGPRTPEALPPRVQPQVCVSPGEHKQQHLLPAQISIGTNNTTEPLQLVRHVSLTTKEVPQLPSKDEQEKPEMNGELVAPSVAGDLVQPSEFSDSEIEETPDINLLDAADSEELEIAQVAAAKSGRFPPRSENQQRQPPAVPQGSGIPGRQTAEHCLNTHDLSSPSHKRPPLNRKYSRSRQAVLMSNPELHSSQTFASSLPQGGQTAYMKPLGVEAPSQKGKRSDLCMKSSSNFARYFTPNSHSIGPTRATNQFSPSPRPDTCLKGKPFTQGRDDEATKSWAGLGQTQAALAQLEWENRKLMHEASRQRARAAKAEVRAAELTVMEEKCVRLTQENKRLLNRLLRFVSPAEAEKAESGSNEADLVQKLSIMTEENNKLMKENRYLMRKNFESLKSCCVSSDLQGETEGARGMCGPTIN